MRRLWAVGVVLALSGSGLGGCVSLLPRSPPVQLYQFGGDAPAEEVPRPASGEAIEVALTEVRLPRAAAGDAILTTRGEEAAYIAGARWLSPAQVLFREQAERSLRSRAPRLRLRSSGAAGAAPVELSLDVDRFEARYGAGDAPPVVAVSVHASLAGAGGGVGAATAFTALRPASEDRVSAIVAAYDAATADVLSQAADWTSREAPRIAAVQPPADRP